MWNEPDERDQLSASLAGDLAPLERLDALIGLAYTTRREPETCIPLLDEADALIDRLKAELREAAHARQPHLLYVRQYCLGETGHQGDATLLAQKALQLYREVDDDRGITSCLLSLTHYHIAQDHHASARRLVTELREFADGGRVPADLTAPVHYEMAHAFFRLDLMEFAKKYGRLAAVDERARFGGLLMVAKAELETGDAEAAAQRAHEARAEGERLGVTDWVISAAELAARALRSLGRLDEAQAVLTDLIGEPGRDLDPMLASAYFELGHIEQDLGHVDRAEARWRSAATVFEATDNRRGLANLLRHHSDLCRKLGRLDEALNMLHRSIELTEASNEEQQRSEIAALAAQHEFDLTSKELEIARVESEALARENTLLQKANAEQREILGVVAHDLASPMSAVMLTADLLVQHATSHGLATVERLGDRIGRAVHFMAEVASLLTLLGRIDGDDIDVTSTKVPLRQVILGVIERVAAAQDQSDLATIDTSGVGDAAMFGEPTHIERVVENLVSNAIKFSPAPAQVSISTTEVDGSVNLIVADRGVGLSEDQLPLLFTKFGRIDNHPPGVTSSTGLGLYISQRLANLMNGAIRAESAGSGQGSTFTLTMPTAPG